MSDTVTIPAGKLEYLEERAKKLAREKAYLQLIMQLMIKIGSARGMEKTIETFIGNILNVIGGTNIILYYRIGDSIHYADVMGLRTVLTTIDDEFVQTVMTTHEPIELEHDFSDSRMLTPEFSKAYTWIYPLMADEEVVGVLKMENLSVALHDMYLGMASVFNFIALKLNSEIQGYAELRQSYERLRDSNAELKKEIHERKMAEEKLAKAHDELEMRVEERTAELRCSEERYRSLLQNVHAGIVLHHGQGLILQSNCMAQELLGLSEDQLLGKALIDPAWHFLREDGSVLPVAEYPVSLVLSSRKPLRDYVTGISSPERAGIVWVLVSGEPEYDAAGEISSVIVSFVDISERKRIEDKLRITQFSVDNAADAIFWIGPDGSFLYANSAACQLLGYSIDEFLQLKTYDMNPEHRGAAWQEHWNALTQQGVLRFETLLARKDGSPISVEITANYVVFEGKERNCGFARDITERKMAEDELRDLNDRLDLIVRERTAELEKRVAEIERMNRVFVGRELRMKELKEKIRKMEKNAPHEEMP